MYNQKWFPTRPPIQDHASIRTSNKAMFPTGSMKRHWWKPHFRWFSLSRIPVQYATHEARLGPSRPVISRAHPAFHHYRAFSRLQSYHYLRRLSREVLLSTMFNSDFLHKKPPTGSMWPCIVSLYNACKLTFVMDKLVVIPDKTRDTSKNPW